MNTFYFNIDTDEYIERDSYRYVYILGEYTHIYYFIISTVRVLRHSGNNNKHSNLCFQYHSPFLRELAHSRPGAWNIQDRPGIYSSTKEQDSVWKKIKPTSWWRFVKETQKQAERIPNAQGWHNLRKTI